MNNSTAFKKKLKVIDCGDVSDADLAPKSKSIPLNQDQINEQIFEASRSGGKSFSIEGNVSSLKALAYAQKMGSKIAIIDCYSTFDTAFAVKCGIDLSTLLIAFPTNALDFKQVMDQLSLSGIELILADNVGYYLDQSRFTPDEYQMNVQLINEAYLALAGSITSVISSIDALTDKKRIAS